MITTSINKVDYDQDNKVLYITYINNTTDVFTSVPIYYYRGLLKSRSKDQFIKNLIKK